MKSSRCIAWFSACLMLAWTPAGVYAQATTTTPTTTTPTTTTPTTTTPTTTTPTTQGSLTSTGTTTTTTTPTKSMTSGAGSATATPSNTNPFVQTYIDPLSVGLPSKYMTKVGGAPSGTFGQPIYKSTTSAGAKGAATTTTQNLGFNTHGNIRAAAYNTVLTDDVPLVVHASGEVLGKVQGLIDRSTWAPSKANIRVSMDGNTVQLQGQVATDKERRIVEGMVRMTPGVVDVVNQLQVSEKK